MTRTQTPTATAAAALVEGRATLDGTKRFCKRFAKTHGDHFYRELANGPLVSSLGLGTYLGDCDDKEDARYRTAAGTALEKGVNLVDTAINYRCQQSERAVGEASWQATQELAPGGLYQAFRGHRLPTLPPPAPEGRPRPFQLAGSGSYNRPTR